jgi:hypothetical protein
MKMQSVLASVLMAVLLVVSAGSGVAGSAPRGAASVRPWSTEEIESGGQVGTHVSVAIDSISGTTYISYYDADNDDLRMARHVGTGGNCGPASAWYCEVVDSIGDVGQYRSPAVDPLTGLPSIAYYGASNGALKYAAAYACDGKCLWVSYTIDGGGADHVNGLYASLDFLGEPYLTATDKCIHTPVPDEGRQSLPLPLR